MGWGVGLLLVALQAAFLSLQPRAAAAAEGDGLPPILSPILDGLCNAECGKGSCKVSLDHAFGFVCDCDPGWTKFHLGDHFQFLPCIIPKCTFNFSCSNSSMAPAPSLPPPPPSNHSLFDPCTWSFCGGEGTCVKTSDFGHRCDCGPGYDNLLNITTFPCFRECAVGGDCESLGIELPHGSPPSSTSSPSSSSRASNRAASMSSRSFIWTFLLLGSLAIVPRT